MARDALGAVLVELQAALATGAFSTAKVRGGERQPADAPPLVLVTHAGQRRRRRIPVVDQRLNVRSYGTTPQAASELARLVSDALHDVGPRVRSGTGVYVSAEEVGAQAATDPVTGWPYELAVYIAVTATTAIT